MRKKTRVIMADPNDYIFFTDKRNEGNLYAMTIEENEKVIKIREQFVNQTIDIPEEYLANVFPMDKTKEIDQYKDEYNITGNQTIEFPINQMNFIMIKYS